MPTVIATNFLMLSHKAQSLLTAHDHPNRPVHWPTLADYVDKLGALFLGGRFSGFAKLMCVSCADCLGSHLLARDEPRLWHCEMF
jgi:hypothetical protein